MKIIFILMLGILLHPGQSLAEIIHLKNGKVINEKIIERGAYYIVTMSKGVPTKYFDGQVDFIEEEPSGGGGSMEIDMTKFKGEEEKVALILKMVDVSGVRASMTANLDQVLTTIPEEKKEKYREILNVTDIIERIIPIYSKYYSEAELKEMIEFYKSPTGQKIVESSPLIMQDTIRETVQYFKEKTTP